MELRIAEVPVICARCRKRMTTLSLTVSSRRDPATIYAVCKSCRTANPGAVRPR